MIESSGAKGLQPPWSVFSDDVQSKVSEYRGLRGQKEISTDQAFIANQKIAVRNGRG
jgi:hypothetical protein